MEARALIPVAVTPRSSRSAITRDEEGRVRVYLNSPPADGRANEELVRLFSRVLGIAKSRISIEKGGRGLNKLLSIEGMTKDQVLDRI